MFSKHYQIKYSKDIPKGIAIVSYRTIYIGKGE